MKNCIYALLVILAACGQKRLSPTDAAATRLCNCFTSKTVGSVEDRLTPCFQRIVSEKQKELALVSADREFFQSQLASFSLDLMVSLTRSCNGYFMEIS